MEDTRIKYTERGETRIKHAELESSYFIYFHRGNPCSENFGFERIMGSSLPSIRKPQHFISAQTRGYEHISLDRLGSLLDRISIRRSLGRNPILPGKHPANQPIFLNPKTNTGRLLRVAQRFGTCAYRAYLSYTLI